MFVCVLQDIAVEAAFPLSGIDLMGYHWVEENEVTMSVLKDGKQYRGECISRLLRSGSRGEGLAMEDEWGHPHADADLMLLNGGKLGVYVAEGQQPRGQSCLEFRHEGCPVAYCKLEVTDITRLRESKVGDGGSWCDESCVDESKTKQWINTYNTVRKMKDTAIRTREDHDVSGPAAQSTDNVDTVQTLVCSGPHPNLHDEYRTRQRESWPPVSLIKYILQMPMLLVLVGHKGSPESEFKQQARLSWSHLELKLIQELPESVRQGYIASKYVMKRFMEDRRGQSVGVYGRSRVCSYHIKNVFLRLLEKRPPSQFTSPFELFLNLLCELDKYLKMGKLPHYFLAECNLLETVSDDEQGSARQVITEILSDPLNALLTSPTDPQQIYGEVRPDDLAIAFRKVSSHLTHGRYRNLSELLARVDGGRRQRFKQQQESDGWWLPGRSELTLLADMLRKIKHNYNVI